MNLNLIAKDEDGWRNRLIELTLIKSLMVLRLFGRLRGDGGK